MFYEEPETPLFARTVASCSGKLKLLQDRRFICPLVSAAGSEVSWELLHDSTSLLNGYLTYAVQDGYSEGSLVIVGEVPHAGMVFTTP